jgi:polar amino acid transport system substrate-binding protein
MATWRSLIAACAAGVIVVAFSADGGAQQAGTGDDAGEQPADAVETMRPQPDLTDLDQIRFLTDNDYPPFNYLDEEGALTGLNVDLARAICEELVVECDVRSADWSGLVPALESGEADAVIASIRTTEKSLAELDFTDPYYYTPARFVALKNSPLNETTPEALAEKKIAVIGGTAHEAFLKDFYGASQIVAFDSSSKARAALRQGETDILFGDGITLMFWLNGTASENCCEFRGGGYGESRYFGEGVGIAVKRGNRKLRAILDYALERMRTSGRLEELYLRYFPLSFF